MRTITLDDEYSYPLHQSGHVSTLPVDYSDDIVQRLRDVVREVTRFEVPTPEKPRIGFLP